MAKQKPSDDASAGWGVCDLERLPKRVSPSRLSDFKQCPAKFFFGSILRLPRWATDATTVGTLAHEAFERVFELPRIERSPEAAVSFVAPKWAELRSDPHYEQVVERGEELVSRAEMMVRSWFGVEDPTGFDPVGNELKLIADTTGVSLLGILDRVDVVNDRVYISDYKTGKVPAPNDRFLADKFFAMRIYALLYQLTTGVTPYKLRLVYVAGGQRGSVRELLVNDQMVDSTRQEVMELWRSAKRCASTGWWPTRKQPLCQWCDYMAVCPAWEGARFSDEISVRAAFGVTLEEV